MIVLVYVCLAYGDNPKLCLWGGGGETSSPPVRNPEYAPESLGEQFSFYPCLSPFPPLLYLLFCCLIVIPIFVALRAIFGVFFNHGKD